MRKINKLTQLCLVAVFCVACGMQAMAQTVESNSYRITLPGSSMTKDMIIRSWMENKSVVYERVDLFNLSYIYLVNPNSLNSTPYLTFPGTIMDYTIADMEVLDNKLFFCGKAPDGNAVMGMLDLHDLMTLGNQTPIEIYHVPLISDMYPSFPLLSNPIEYKKMEVFNKFGEYHIVAIGETLPRFNNKLGAISVLTDLVLGFSPKIYYSFDRAGKPEDTDRKCRYDDIAVTDKSVVVTGRFIGGVEDPVVLQYPKPNAAHGSIIPLMTTGHFYLNAITVMPSNSPVSPTIQYATYVDNNGKALSPVRVIKDMFDDIYIATEGRLDHGSWFQKGYCIDKMRVDDSPIGIVPSHTILQERMIEVDEFRTPSLIDFRRSLNGYTLLYRDNNESCIFKYPVMYYHHPQPDSYSYIIMPNNMYSVDQYCPDAEDVLQWVGKEEPIKPLVGKMKGVSDASPCYLVNKQVFHLELTPYSLSTETVKDWYFSADIMAMTYISNKCRVGAQPDCSMDEPINNPKSALASESVDSESQVVMMPNPASSQVTISSTEDIISIEVYDMSGKKVFEQNCESNEVQLDVSGWAKGVYAVHTNTQSGTTSKKLIVQ